MELSIIIAHFDPGNHPHCFDSFCRTLEEINKQKSKHSIEIIIADDGSPMNSNISSMDVNSINWNDRIIFDMVNHKLLHFLNRKKLPGIEDISHWLYLPKNPICMSKARLWNAAASISKSEYLLFLDDDNYFISENSIQNVIKLLQNYSVVFGQIKDSNGRFRKYSSNRVQGTTFAIKKDVLKNIGGFGEWTEKTSCGIDSDFWFKLHKYFSDQKEIQVCYTDTIQSIDSCSKRWRPQIKHIFRNRKIKNQFFEIHGCIDYKSTVHNPSRVKSNWIVDLT